jgi:hypothetical protein
VDLRMKNEKTMVLSSDEEQKELATLNHEHKKRKYKEKKSTIVRK